MSFLDEILAATRETVGDIKQVGQKVVDVFTPKKSILEEVQSEQPNFYVDPKTGQADPFKSKFYVPEGGVRAQTEKEKRITDEYVKRKWENELVKTIKAPYRAVEETFNWLSNSINGGLVADILETLSFTPIPGYASFKPVAEKIRKQAIADNFRQGVLSEATGNKGLIGGIQEGSPSSIVWALTSGITSLLLAANPYGAAALWGATWGGISLEGEEQWKTGIKTKASAYTLGTISAALDYISAGKLGSALMKSGLKKEVAATVSDKIGNLFKKVKSSNFEALTEIVQQGVEDLGRYLGGIEVTSNIKDYAEVGLLGKILGKVGDVSENLQKNSATTAFQNGLISESEAKDFGVDITPELQEQHKKAYQASQEDIKNNIREFATKLADEGNTEVLKDLYENLPEDLQDAIPVTPVTETAKATAQKPVITQKESNLLNQKVNTNTVQDFISSTEKILTDKWYTVETKTGIKAKGFASQYLIITKGDNKVTVRVSNHVLKDQYVDKYGTPDFSIDISGNTKVPFDKIASKLEGQAIAPQVQNFNASKRIDEFNATKDTLSDAEVVQFAQGNNADQTLNAAIEEEIRKRGITDEQILTLAEEPIAPKAPPVQPTPKKSILEEIQSESTLEAPFWKTSQTEPVAVKNSTLDYTKKNVALEQKSGYKLTPGNIALGVWAAGLTVASAGIPFIWPGIAVTIGMSSLWTLPAVIAPKVFDTFFMKQRVLNAYRDKNGIPALQLVTNEKAQGFKRAGDFVDEFLGQDYLQKTFDTKAQENIASAYDLIYQNIDTILKDPAENLKNGEPLSAKEKVALKNMFKAALNDTTYNNLIFDPDILWTIKKRMPVLNLAQYYPKQVTKLLKDNNISVDFILPADVMSGIKKGTDFGFSELVKAEELREQDQSTEYERYKVLRDTYIYDIKQGKKDTAGGYDSIEELLAARKIEYKIAQGERKVELANEIKRLETSIQKEKSDDTFDVYRVHDPLAQFLDYAVQYSETITRKQIMDIIEVVNDIDPVQVGTKKFFLSDIFNVSLIDDLFFPNKIQLPSFSEIKRAYKLYGQEYTKIREVGDKGITHKVSFLPRNAEQVGGLINDVLSGALRWAYWLIAGPKQIVQGVNSVALVNSFGLLKSWVRTLEYGVFKRSNEVGVFFLKNRLSSRTAYGKSMISSQIKEALRTNGEMSRFGLSRLYNNAADIGDIYAQTMFGGPAEISISEHIILWEIYDFVRTKTKQDYTVGSTIDTEAMLEAFQNSPKITKTERAKKLAEWRIIAQSVFDGITQTGSGIGLSRIPYTKFFNRFVSSSASQAIYRLSDMRSLILDVFKAPTVKQGLKDVFNSKNAYYRQSTKKVMSMALTSAALISIIEQVLNSMDDDDDENRKKANEAQAYYIFQRMFGMNIQNQILSAVSGIISTPADFYDKILYHFDDVIQGLWKNNKTQTELGISNLISSMGMVKALVTAVSPETVWVTSYMNVKELQNTDWFSWFNQNVSRFYTTEGEKTKILDKMAENPNMDFNGFFYLSQLAKTLWDMEFDTDQNGLARILLEISPGLKEFLPVGKDTVDATEKFVAAQEKKLKDFTDVDTVTQVIDRTESGTFNDIVVDAVLALWASNKPDSYKYIRDLEKKLMTLRKSDRKLEWMLDVDGYKPFMIANQEYDDGKALIEKIKKDPIIYAQFMRSIQNLAEDGDDVNAKKKTRQAFSGDVAVDDSILDAIAYQNKSPVFSNAFVDSMMRSFKGKESDFNINTGTPEEVQQKLATMEAYLRVAAHSKLTSEAGLRGMQILLGDKFETQITDLFDKNLFRPEDFPALSESLVTLMDARGDLKKPEAKDQQSQIDVIKASPNLNAAIEAIKPIEVKEKVDPYGSVIPNFGLIIDAPDAQWPNGICLLTQPNAKIASPYDGVVVEANYVVGLWNQVKVQDSEGRIMQYSNLQGFNVKPGDFIKSGEQFGVSRQNGLQCTLFDEKWLITDAEKTAGYLGKKTTINARPTPTVEAPSARDRNLITPPVNSTQSEKWVLGTTPIDKIIESILQNVYKSGKIDFTKIKPKIKSWQKKSPKPVKTSQRKSILEEIMENS